MQNHIFSERDSPFVDGGNGGQMSTVAQATFFIVVGIFLFISL